MVFGKQLTHLGGVGAVGLVGVDGAAGVHYNSHALLILSTPLAFKGNLLAGIGAQPPGPIEAVEVALDAF